MLRQSFLAREAHLVVFAPVYVGFSVTFALQEVNVVCGGLPARNRVVILKAILAPERVIGVVVRCCFLVEAAPVQNTAIIEVIGQRVLIDEAVEMIRERAHSIWIGPIVDARRRRSVVESFCQQQGFRNRTDDYVFVLHHDVLPFDW